MHVRNEHVALARLRPSGHDFVSLPSAWSNKSNDLHMEEGCEQALQTPRNVQDLNSFQKGAKVQSKESEKRGKDPTPRVKIPGNSQVPPESTRPRCRPSTSCTTPRSTESPFGF